MLRQRSRPLLLVFVLVGAFAIMLLDSSGLLAPAQNLIHGLLRPLGTTLTDLRGSGAELIETARDLRTLRQRNTELEALIDRLSVENLELAEVAAENEQLRSLLAFAQTNPTFDFRGGQIIARIIGGPASTYLDLIEIDLGNSHGLAQGMPVVTDRGFVGRIVRVFDRSSEVLLLTDPSSAVNVMTQGSRAPGVLRGRAGQLPRMELIPPDVELAIGDIVMTSGLGRQFPKGLVVGQIIAIEKNDNRPFQQAIIQPTVDFDRLELALVITTFPPSPPEEEEEETPGLIEPTPTP